MRTRLYRAVHLGGIVTLLASMAGCTATTRESALPIERYVTQVSDGTGNIQATLVPGDPPEPNGGPVNTVAGFPAMVSGGSAQQTLNGGASFTRVVVKVPGATNYYEMQVPASASRDLVIHAATTLPNMSLPVAYAVGDAGSLGPYTVLSTRVISVGTGDIQISVSWSDSSDVDLHVIDPSNEELYYGHKSAASGGTLDLDSNAACTKNTLPDNSRAFLSNENVVWPTGKAVSGTYTVRLTYWSACGITAGTDYLVTVARAGAVSQIFRGTFQPPGTSGGAGSGILITTFTY